MCAYLPNRPSPLKGCLGSAQATRDQGRREEHLFPNTIMCGIRVSKGETAGEVLLDVQMFIKARGGLQWLMIFLLGSEVFREQGAAAGPNRWTTFLYVS